MAKERKQIELDWELHSIVGSASVAKRLCDLLAEKGLGRYVGSRFEFYHSNLKNLKSKDLRMDSKLTKPLQRYLNILIAGGIVTDSDYNPKLASLNKLVLNATGCSSAELPSDYRFKAKWFKKITSEKITSPLSGAKEEQLFTDVFQALNYIVGESEYKRGAIGIIKGNSVLYLLTKNRELRKKFFKFFNCQYHSWVIAIESLEDEAIQSSSWQSFYIEELSECIKTIADIENDINDQNKEIGKLSRIKIIHEDNIGQEGVFFSDCCAILYAPVGTPSIDRHFFSAHSLDKLTPKEQKCISRLRGKFRNEQAARR